jgi:methionyl-tRNA formyltransferase
MKVLFAGTPANAAEVLRGVVSAGHEVVAVLTREDAPIGRKKVITASAVSLAAGELGIPTIKANRITEEIAVRISNTGAELAIVVAYGIILNQETLNLLPKGWFNLHFSLLPKWRGAAPVQRAIQAGDSDTGVTMFKIDPGLDTGPILASVPTPIGPDETAGDLVNRLTKLGTTLVNAELPKIYSGLEELHPQLGEATKATKPTRADAKIVFDSPAKKIENQVRAMNPEPMAWCLYEHEPIRVIQVRTSQKPIDVAATSEEPGTLYNLDGRVYVRCQADSWLELLHVQPASRNGMSARDWVNGLNRLGVLE